MENKQLLPFLPLIGFLACDLIAVLLGVFFSLSLRSAPTLFCVWGSFLALLLAGGYAFRQLWRHLRRTAVKVLSVFAAIPLAGAAGVIGLYLFVFGLFGYMPEHVVEQNGQPMLARVNSFLDESVSFYEYKGPLFYGRQLGVAYYGSGSGDPIAEGQEPRSVLFFE